MSDAPWYVYLVECSDGTLYTGVAKDVTARVAVHNEGRGAKYTRGRLPVRLVFSEPAISRGAALARELEIKAMPSSSKWRLAGLVKG